MHFNTNHQDSWRHSLNALLSTPVIAMLFLGFSAGIPLLLIFSSLSLWLGEAGVERSMITYFSWAALAYSFKFLWAPLIDRLPVPFLTRTFGRRRAWLLVSQCLIITSICAMAFTDPAQGQQQLTWMAIATVCLGISAATQDIVVDAFRIESGSTDLQALMSSTYITGYRIGMLTAGAGALFLAGYFGSSKNHYLYSAWQNAYLIMASVMLIGICTSLILKEPEQNHSTYHHSAAQYARFVLLFLLSVGMFVYLYSAANELTTYAKAWLANILHTHILAGLISEALRLITALTGMLVFAYSLTLLKLVEKTLVTESYVDAVRDFFRRYGVATALLLLLFVGFYRVSDIVLGVISNVFFQDMGYSKYEIASVVKTFGLFMTIAGGFLGGILSLRFGVMKILFLGALLTVLTNFLFMVLANTGHNLPMLYLVISADNLAGGLASAAFIAFLSSLTNISFTAVQYAIFSSLMTLIPKGIGGYSGSMVDSMGYSNFFLIASLMGVPVLFLVLLVRKRLD